MRTEPDVLPKRILRPGLEDGRQDNVAVLRVANGHVLLSGNAQSSKGTYESGAVVVVRDGFKGFLRRDFGS